MHLARVLKNEELNLTVVPKDGILAKMAQNPELGCGNDTPWEPWKSPTPTFPPFPPRLEIPQRTRDSHISPATTAAGTVYP